MHTEWGSGDCKRIGGENVLVGGYNRVGVGPSFCSLHFSLLPWRAEMGRGSCHLTCECFKGSPGFFRKLPFSQPPSPPATRLFFKQKQHGVFEPQSDPKEGLCG